MYGRIPASLINPQHLRECAMTEAQKLFTKEWSETVFPPERAEAFFDALYGGAEEGAFDIALRFLKEDGNTYEFAFDLTARPGRCLVCGITRGLPHVFSRHPVINVKGLAAAIAARLGVPAESIAWELKPVMEVSADLFRIPLIVTVL